MARTESMGKDEEVGEKNCHKINKIGRESERLNESVMESGTGEMVRERVAF